MINLQNCLIELAPYNIDFKTKDSKVLLGIEYNENWQVIKPENKNIECFKYGEKYYYGTIMSDEKSIEDIFNIIKTTIDYNKDLEKKINLLQQKINELQEIFVKEDYNDLLNLTFHIKKSKKNKKKTLTAEEKKEEISTNNDIVETKIDFSLERENDVEEDIKYINTIDNEEPDNNDYSVDELNNFIGIK